MTTAELVPVADHTLYHLTDELAALLGLRSEMEEAKDDTTAVDEQIAEYMAALPEKVDAVVHVLRTFESQAELASAEVKRLTARRRKFASAVERLKEYCCNVLEKMPKPNKGSRRLEGSTATLALKTNGGVEPMTIYDESLVPDEYCLFEVRLNCEEYLRFKAADAVIPELPIIRTPDNQRVRKALSAPCWLCDGNGADCSECGGSGHSTVPGARLEPRGSHLEIR